MFLILFIFLNPTLSFTHSQHTCCLIVNHRGIDLDKHLSVPMYSLLTFTNYSFPFFGRLIRFHETMNPNLSSRWLSFDCCFRQHLTILTNRQIVKWLTLAPYHYRPISSRISDWICFFICLFKQFVIIHLTTNNRKLNKT